MRLTSTADVVSFVTHDLVPLVAAVRVFQDRTGAIAGDPAVVRSLLDRVRAATHTAFALVGADDAQRVAFDVDLDGWLVDLSASPRFDRSVRAVPTVEPGELSVVVAPMLAINGPPPVGHFFEAVLALRDEPEGLDDLAEAMPGCTTHSQSMRVLAGTRGVMLGSCLACFPEFLAATRRPQVQEWGMFYVSKFPGVYQRHTLPAVAAVLGDGPWRSAQLSPAELYTVRALWGTVHDHFHEHGPRPLTMNVALHTRWEVTVVEELKVDCQTAAAMQDTDIRYARELAETVLFDRFFRLPAEPGADRSADAAAGVLMCEWLIRERVITQRGDRLRLDVDACLQALPDLAAQLARLDDEPTDEGYVRAACGLITSWLPCGTGRARYGDPRGYARLVRPGLPRLGLLDFTRPLTA
jgi:hypothetical protein